MVAPAAIKEKAKEGVKKKVVDKSKIKTQMRPEHMPTLKEPNSQKISGDGGGDDDDDEPWDDFYNWSPPKTGSSSYGTRESSDSYEATGHGKSNYPSYPQAKQTERKIIEPDKKKMLTPPPPPGGEDKDESKIKEKDSTLDEEQEE